MIGAAVTVAKIATGEIEETTDDGKSKAAQELGRKGGKVRAEKRRRSAGWRLREGPPRRAGSVTQNYFQWRQSNIRFFAADSFWPIPRTLTAIEFLHRK